MNPLTIKLFLQKKVQIRIITDINKELFYRAVILCINEKNETEILDEKGNAYTFPNHQIKQITKIEEKT